MKTNAVRAALTDPAAPNQQAVVEALLITGILSNDVAITFQHDSMATNLPPAEDLQRDILALIPEDRYGQEVMALSSSTTWQGDSAALFEAVLALDVATRRGLLAKVVAVNFGRFNKGTAGSSALFVAAAGALGVTPRCKLERGFLEGLSKAGLVALYADLLCAIEHESLALHVEALRKLKTDDMVQEVVDFLDQNGADDRILDYVPPAALIASRSDILTAAAASFAQIPRPDNAEKGRHAIAKAQAAGRRQAAERAKAPAKSGEASAGKPAARRGARKTGANKAPANKAPANKAPANKAPATKTK